MGLLAAGSCECLCLSTYTGDIARDDLLRCVGNGCGVTLLNPALLEVLSPFTGVTGPLRDKMPPVGVIRLNTSEMKKFEENMIWEKQDVRVW